MYNGRGRIRHSNMPYPWRTVQKIFAVPHNTFIIIIICYLFSSFSSSIRKAQHSFRTGKNRRGSILSPSSRVNGPPVCPPLTVFVFFFIIIIFHNGLRNSDQGHYVIIIIAAIAAKRVRIASFPNGSSPRVRLLIHRARRDYRYHRVSIIFGFGKRAT